LIKTDLFNVLLLIALALIFARLFGFIFYKFKQPAVIGEIIAGIIIGGIGLFFIYGQEVSLFGYSVTLPNLNLDVEIFNFLAKIGILFLLFLSGLEISVSKLKRMGKTSLFVAIGGVFVPFIFGFLICYFLNNSSWYVFSFQECIIVGLILTATSVGVTARALMDIGSLDSDVGATILGGAVIDDAIAIILLAFTIGIDTLMGAIGLILRIAIFFVIFLFLGLKVIDKILDLGEKIHLPKAFLSISLSILLIYSFFADKAGISGIIGAFVAGVLIGQNVRSVKIEGDIKAIAYGFFVPLFFVGVGSSLWKNLDSEFSDILDIILLALIISLIAIIGKIIGSGIGAKIGGMSRRESLQVGIGMIPRMELALIIAAAAVSNKIVTEVFAHQILLITVILTIVTTLLAPLLVKATFKNI
jgi:Kef-type K+ transport system membrane component KefB